MDWSLLAQIGIQRFGSCEHGNERSCFNKRLTIFQLYFQTVSSLVQNMLHVSASPQKTFSVKNVKTKQSHYRPGQELRVPGV